MFGTHLLTSEIQFGVCDELWCTLCNSHSPREPEQMRKMEKKKKKRRNNKKHFYFGNQWRVTFKSERSFEVLHVKPTQLFKKYINIQKHLK